MQLPCRAMFTVSSAEMVFRLTDNPHHPERAREKIGYDLHENDEITREGENEFMPDLITR